MIRFLSAIASTVFFLAACHGHACDLRSGVARPEESVAARTLEVGCATCVYDMAGVEGCLLAVKLEGEPYLVSGVEMPGHESGLCDHSRTAKLTGELEGERFVATTFELPP